MPSSRNRIFGLAIERAGEEHALALAARQRRPHVADQRQVLHRHAHDVGVHLSRHSGFPHALHVEIGVEAGDVVGDRAGQQRSSCATTPTVARQARQRSGVARWPSSSIEPSVGWLRPSSSFSSVVLPPPEGP